MRISSHDMAIRALMPAPASADARYRRRRRRKCRTSRRPRRSQQPARSRSRAQRPASGPHFCCGCLVQGSRLGCGAASSRECGNHATLVGRHDAVERLAKIPWSFARSSGVSTRSPACRIADAISCLATSQSRRAALKSRLICVSATTRYSLRAQRQRGPGWPGRRPHAWHLRPVAHRRSRRPTSYTRTSVATMAV